MKPYSILIRGTGTCGEGNAESADMALQKLLEQLNASGHKLGSVSMIIDGSAVPIIGSLEPHPAAGEPASPDAVSLVTVNRNLEQLIQLFTADKQPGEEQAEAGVTLSDIAQQLVEIDRKFDTVIVAAQKKEATPRPTREPKQPVEKKKGPPEGKPDENAQMLNPNGAPAGALPLQGSTGVAGGDEAQPPSWPPPDGVEQTAGDDAGPEGTTTTETPKKEEGAEG